MKCSGLEKQNVCTKSSSAQPKWHLDIYHPSMRSTLFHPQRVWVCGTERIPLEPCVWIFVSPRPGLRLSQGFWLVLGKETSTLSPRAVWVGKERGEWSGALGHAVSQNGTTHSSVVDIHLSTPFVRTISGYIPPFYALHSFSSSTSMSLWDGTDTLGTLCLNLC